MNMINIKNFNEAVKTLKNLNRPIIGIGVTAFNRVGLEKMLPNFHIVCLYDNKENGFIKKFVDIFVVKDKKDIKIRKNTLTILKDEKTIKHISSFNKPFLLFYNPDNKIAEVCFKHGWKIIGNFKKAIKEIGNKVFFRKLLKKLNIPLMPGEITKLSKLDYKKLKQKYGKVVIQLPDSSGGRGTFFIKTQKDFDDLKKFKEQEVIVTKFIEGHSPSIIGCVTKYGVLCTNLQYQILDVQGCINLKSGNGLFCGHDWVSSKFPEDIEKQAYGYVEKIGNYLKKIGYKGIFGLDLLWDKKENKLYVIECNARLLGSFPPLIMIQLMNKEVPLILFHILEFLNVPYKMDFKKINKEIKKQKIGSQIILYNKIGSNGINKSSLKAGIYIFENDELIFKKPGHSLQELNKDEFLITEVPFKNTIFKPNERVCRILMLEKMFDENLKLNKKTISIIKKVYSILDIKPI